MCESGKFYGFVVDPILKPMRKYLASEIKSNATVIDIACGTGAQVFELAKKAKSVVGIDYSDSMLSYARKSLSKLQLANIEFLMEDATNLSSIKTNSFDVATMTLALHQFNPDLHKPILNEMKRVARKIIIIDYAVPLPKNYSGFGSKIAEFLAGKEHNRNFKSYYKLGGLEKILVENDLQIHKSTFIGKGAFQLAVCS